MEPEDLLVELDPEVHAVQLDVRDRVIERKQPDWWQRIDDCLACLIAGRIDAPVVAPLDEGVDGLAIGLDRRPTDYALPV